jgi:hypothetical protein
MRRQLGCGTMVMSEDSEEVCKRKQGASFEEITTLPDTG